MAELSASERIRLESAWRAAEKMTQAERAAEIQKSPVLVFMVEKLAEALKPDDSAES